MTFLIVHFLMAPVLLLIAGLCRMFPPKRINYFYGYRTARSMGSHEAWLEANQYSTRLMFRLAWLLMVFQLAAYWLLGPEQSLLPAAGFFILGLGVLIYLTERHLKRMGY
jgi:uncharacterized membrane protein